MDFCVGVGIITTLLLFTPTCTRALRPLVRRNITPDNGNLRNLRHDINYKNAFNFQKVSGELALGTGRASSRRILRRENRSSLDYAKVILEMAGESICAIKSTYLLSDKMSNLLIIIPVWKFLQITGLQRAIWYSLLTKLETNRCKKVK